MPLAHLVASAKRNTPPLRIQPVLEAEKPSSVENKPEIPGTDLKRAMAEISESEKIVAEAEKTVPEWQQCQYFKQVGEKSFCAQYLSLCAESKCQRKFMDANFFDFKKYLKQGKPVK